MKYVRYAGLILNVVLISDACFGMIPDGIARTGNDERPPVQQKSPEQLAKERKLNRERIWQSAYERAYLGIKHDKGTLRIKLGRENYELSRFLGFFKLKYNDSKAGGSDNRFKIAPIVRNRIFTISYNGNDAIFNLIWDTNGTIIVNDICCATNKIPVYIGGMPPRPFAIKGTKVIMIGDNAVGEIAVSADDRIINCGRLFCSGDCRLISDKIINYDIISDSNSRKPKNDDAKFVGVDNRFYGFYKTHSNLFNLPVKNGFYNFGVLDFKDKYVSTEDLEVNLIGFNTHIEKTLTQTGNDRVLRIINGDFYKSATQEALKKEEILYDVGKSGIHIGGLSTGMIYTNVLPKSESSKKYGQLLALRKGSPLKDKEHEIEIGINSNTRINYIDTKLTVGNLNKPKILTWSKRHENVMSELDQSGKMFNSNEEIAHISGIQNRENFSGNKGEHDISVGQYGDSVYLVDGVWRKSQGATGWLGKFGQQLADYLSKNKKNINSDGYIYNLHEYLLGDTDSKKKPKTETTLVLGAANNPFSSIIREYYEFEELGQADIVYDNFLVRIYKKNPGNTYSYVMTCDVSADPEGKASITEYLSDGAFAYDVTKEIIRMLNELLVGKKFAYCNLNYNASATIK